MGSFQSAKSFIFGRRATVDLPTRPNPALPTSRDLHISENASSQFSYSLVDPESHESLGPSDSCDSTDIEKYDSNDNREQLRGLERTGEQFQRRESMEEPDNELMLTQLSAHHNGSNETNLVAIAPFRQGGLPNLGNEIILSRPTEPSDPSDRGQRRYSREHRPRGHKPRSRRRGHSGHGACLQDSLFEALQNRDLLTQGFFPTNSLNNIITARAVKNELRRHFPRATYDHDLVWKYARQICGENPVQTTTHEHREKRKSFHKIFAILVMCNMTPKIINFLEEGLSDSDLPLKLVIPPTGRYDLQRQEQHGSRLNFFRRGWTDFQMCEFSQWQWTTLAPFFERADGHRDVNHYPLFPRSILPFTEVTGVEGTEEGGGGFVFEAKIHPDHHTFHNQECAYNPESVAEKKKPEIERHCACRFAVKRLHSRERSTFNQEVDILKKFSNERHSHLISLLATYERKDKFYLIFPFAEANLNSYWKKVHPSPCIDKATVWWVAEQCKGIANGVVHIHAYESSRSDSHLKEPRKLLGHHGDIKPDNVLWFSTPAGAKELTAHSPNFRGGTLKLTDFGLAGLDTRRTVSRDIGDIAISRDYCAPEFDVDGDCKPGRQKDMWALGCVYLEFITWLVGGWPLVEEFRNARKMKDPNWNSFETSTFFMLDTRSVIKPKVIEVGYAPVLFQLS
ncbi:kinase-like domain-containing protein [Pseudoneurospora amorphoporcata]|uniref:Kinase-like domain-containing protein n=1 Tax=Pseudoneurospora amorphoporcata TaxID=241081 RepID=A0AAN6NQE3_9PEZI|nr:kinase-like domain-containing protein [Pseudoneurospora amorphoporcata]